MRYLKRTLASASVLLALSPAIGAADRTDMEDTISVTSSAFDHHANVPLKYTAYGDNVAPQVAWSDLPPGTVELVLIMDDPVAPTPEPFVHWVAYNIPADAGELPEGLSKEARVSDVPALEGMINGRNGFRQTGYFGPRPPADGKLHAYHFRIYALGSDLDLEEGLGKQEVLDAIEGHILGTGMLMGHYQQE